MKIKIKKILRFVVWSLVLAPSLAFAITDEELIKLCSPGKPVGGICLPARPDGARDFETLGQLTTFIVEVLLLAVGLISVIFVLIGGYQYITGGEDEEKVKKAKNMIQNALIGMVIVLLAFALVRITINLVGGNV